jgi:hypothetical protein
MKSACLLLSLFYLVPAFAGDWEFEPNTSLWGILSQRRVHEGSLNPGNVYSRTPDQAATLELRPDLNLRNGTLKLSARPRLLLDHQRISTSASTSRDTDLLLRWSEAFASWSATESFSLSYGLQNFQWGPAESASPSNRIFRDTVQVKDSFYVVNGHHLLRASFTPSNSFSEILLVELSGNGDPEPEPYERHAKKALLKSELSWNGGSEYAGLVLGWRDRFGAWAGEYLNVEPLEGLTLYADASHQAGSLAFYPGSDSSGRYLQFSQSRRGQSRLYTFAAGGARYAFENGNDWRLEYIFQEAGYTSGEIRGSRAALLSRDPLQLLMLASRGEVASRNGLDFPGRQYLYSSARFPNAFGTRDWNLYARALRSLQDSSSSVLGSSECAVGENGSFIASVAAAMGGDGDELKGTVDLGGTLAYRHAW